MHDDSCKEYAQGHEAGPTVHCWLDLNHRGPHFDRALGIYWRKGTQSVPVTVIPRAAPPRWPWRPRLAVAA